MKSLRDEIRLRRVKNGGFHLRRSRRFITKQHLKSLGWKRGKAISNFANGKMLTKGIYYNSNGHLPSTPGRVWREADINYKTGKRNSQRVLWSNDGLIFVTYDHYETFYEII